MPVAPSHLVTTVINQHVEESAILRNIRSVLLTAPHVKLHQLRRLDDRIAAHLDGLAIAGDFGVALSMEALETPGVGEVFAAAVRAIEDADKGRLDRLFAVAEAVPEAQPGLISSFGWVSSQVLQGTVSQLLASGSPFRRRVGIAACAMHRVSPGAALDAALEHLDSPLRARALRTLGDLGKRDTLASVRDSLEDENEGCRFWAARSAVLLGDRESALARLASVCQAPGPQRERAMHLTLRAMDVPRAHELLKLFARELKDIRPLIQGAGIAGDPHYVPWLIRHMDDLKLARLAGESFTFITGLDLAYLNLDRRRPEGVEFGPNDNPEDDDVSMDPDDSLPWPDRQKITAWWTAHSQRFQSGVRYFMGEPVSRGHCLTVLKEGCQRQRIAAAEFLCLLDPGTGLFPTSAPAWRQQRWLAEMS
ncbi:TIGR02270 family protein [Thauera sp. 2A1]|uniref:TIGR02270 family protein n=1 Tax=Thauera sp. 2A1 TaxID=2570191 RepID=UPI001290C2F4|nr:TIGR02270 family protein [Thauera sp. 2A1]KAI5916446.1 TIGR02270 family protein [Thauera sp. 2A1]